MNWQRGSQVEHYRLVGGRHLELAGTWPSIPIGTSATQITRYAGLALSMALLAAFLLPQRSQAASNPADKENKQDLAPLILSPTSNSTITGSTVVFQILLRGRDSDQFTALLDGLDVTSLFKKGKGRTRRAQVSPAELHLGSNHFKMTVGSSSSSVTFRYYPKGTPGPPGSSQGQPLLVPVQTRVLAPGTDGSKNTDYEIVIGDSLTGQTVYRAQDTDGSGGGGFQIVLLKRTDLSLVMNFSGATETELGVEGWIQQLQPAYTNLCGPGGCLAIIQSLTTIGVTCTSGVLTQQDCFNYINAFSGIGATSALPTAVEGSNPHVAYSFIGNVGSEYPVPAGVFYERLTCSDSSESDCDNGQPLLAQTAPAGAPPSQIGNMSGVLVLDNNLLYTFRPNQPRVTFSSVYDPDTATHTVTLGNLQEVSSDLNSLGSGPDGEIGGFHLVVFDTTGLEAGVQPTTAYNETYTVHYIPPASLPSSVHNITQLPQDIAQFQSRRYLFFLGSVGSLSHPEGCPDYNNKANCTDYADPNYMGEWVVCPTRLTCRGFAGIDIWDQVNVSLYHLFGTDYATFELLDHPPAVTQQVNPFGTHDDYSMVSRLWVPKPQTNVLSPYPIEVSSVKSAQIAANPVASNMAGFLQIDHQGYYQPKLVNQYDGLTPEIVASLAVASLQPNTSWPLTGAGSTSGQQAAYTWISQQLCAQSGGDCDSDAASDIRANYNNLNDSANTWLILLKGLEYDPDAPGFTEDDFNDAQAQLQKEFIDVESVTNLEKNINTLYLGSGVDIANILTTVENEVIYSLNVTAPNKPASTPNWLSVTEDIFNVVGPASGFLGLTGPEGTGAAVALQTAIGLGTTLVSTSAMETNDGSGVPLMQQEEAVLSTVGQLAATATNQFNENFLSLGNTFDRILNDWGRLQAVAGPLTDSTLTWKDQTTGYLLQAYSVAVRREFYAAVLSQTHRIVHFEYAKPDPDPNGANGASCNFGDFMAYAQTPRESWAWLPGAMIDGPFVQATQRHYFYQNDKWWDLWLFEPNSAPTDCSNTGKIDFKQFFQQTGLFTPIDTDTSTPGLGLYKPTFYKRSGLPVVDSDTNNPYWGSGGVTWPSNGDPAFR